MKRWLLWFALAPHTFLVAGLGRDLGLPAFDFGVLACLYLAFFAERSALPWLLFGLAAGRGLVDAAALPVQLLVLGIPVGVLLPLRALVFGQSWLALLGAAALCASVIPRLAVLLGAVFDQPSTTATTGFASVLWTTLLAPPLLWLLRAVPPFAAFEERR